MAAARCMGLLVASSAHARTGPSEVVKKAGPGLALWQEPSQALAYVRHGVRVHMSMVWRVARTPFLIRVRDGMRWPEPTCPHATRDVAACGSHCEESTLWRARLYMCR